MIGTYSYKISESPHLLISGAIHGDEICGPLSIERLRQQLDSGEILLLQGCLTLIPVCNPEAYKRHVRYVDKNLNRIFCKHIKPSCYEEKIANLLLPYFKQAEYLLDIHSFHADGDPFIFQDHLTSQEAAFAESLGVSPILVGWPEMYNRLESNVSCTTDYASTHHIPGLTLECGQHRDPQAPEIGYQAILRALSYLKMIDPCLPPLSSQPQRVRMQKVYFRKHAQDRFARAWKHMDPVKAGELLATYADQEHITAPQDGFVALPRQSADLGDEWIYFAIAAN